MTEQFPENNSLVGQEFVAVAFAIYNLENQISKGKNYQIKVIAGDFEARPLARFIDDNGVVRHAHLSRFRKL
jgi:hypothetical protein